jgi:hypothetical protein
MENITLYFENNRELDIYFKEDIIAQNGASLETENYFINLETMIAHPKGEGQSHYFYAYYRDI